MAAKRPVKGKSHIALPGDFIALGKPSKPGIADSESAKGAVPKKLGVPAERKREAPTIIGPSVKKLGVPAERKREAPTISGPSVKKPKLLGQTFTPLGRSDLERKNSPAPQQTPQFEELAIEVDSQDLLDEILVAEDTCNDERLEGLFCGAIKHLHSNRSKPDPAVYLTLMYLAKTKAALFNSDVIIQAFCTLLKRDMSLNFKSKGNALVSVCACSVLMAAFVKEDNWPDDFIKVFVEDSLGERVWVDRADCKAFVDNIITGFNTSLPAKSAVAMETAKDQSGTASPVIGFLQDEDDKEPSEVKISALVEMENVAVIPRYPYQQESIEMFILDVIREQSNRRQPMDATSRNLIRLMTATCGYGEVRLLAAQRLEMWIQNPKLARPAQELLMSICMNCNQHDQRDLETIAVLIKIRIKTKPLLNHFLNCLRELLGQHPENIRMIMTHTVYNELSATRNPNNMAIIGVLFQKSGEQSARILAEVFQDLLANKDDYLRVVRGLFREIVRALRHDINVTSFCLGLMQERVEAKFLDLDHNFKERYVTSIGDLVTLAIFLCITPTVREAAAALSRGENKDIEALHAFRQQVALIQRDSVWWLHTIVPKIIEVKLSDYVHCLHKVLFMESADQYYNKDNWPSESDRGSFLHLSTNVPVLEDTLMRVLVIGLSRELPLGPVDAVELADQLVKRAASLCLDGQVVLQMEKLELVDALMNLCSYRHPTDISLPKGYKPPTLAISNLYWKSWVILLILAAFNPQTFGLTGWENYPTLKCLMEMVMTGNFVFPPPTMAVDDTTVEDIRNREMQYAQQEKQQILEFETHLAAASSKVTITEANSLLIAQLTSMDPNGIARTPPTAIIEQLKLLNDNLKIGQMLCRSRQPDFLLDIIQRQGRSQSMPWLAELVESSEGSLDVLPVQCLCEFLLHDDDTPSHEEDSKHMGKHKKKQKLRKREQLLHRLRSLVWSENNMTSQVLDYFLKRLSSTQASNRALAIRGLSMVIAKEDSMETDESMPHKWLCMDLPLIPSFSTVYPQIAEALRQACQIEIDPALVSAYIIFLSQQAENQSLHELDGLALDIAQLIVDRTTVVNHILPQEDSDEDDTTHITLQALISLYFNYLTKAKEPSKEAYSWSNTQDQILLQWEGGDSATMHVLVVHAMIILLTYGPPNGESDYKELLDTWFPENGHPPSAFLLDTSEEALLLPDWLKLRMIRSHVTQLVDVALQDIEPGQLLLFVQSFGIPVASMSQLFSCLDNAVGVAPEILEDAVEDKAYMAQLIEIQHMRGVKGGDIFYKLLKQVVPTYNDDEEMVERKEMDRKWSLIADKVSQQTPMPLTSDLIVKIFNSDTSKSTEAQQWYYKLVHTLSSPDTTAAIELTQILLEMLGGPHGKTLSLSLSKSPKCSALLKLLVSKKEALGGLLYKMMETFFSLIKCQRSPATSIINQYLMSTRESTTERKPSSKTKGGASSQHILEELDRQTKGDEHCLEKVLKQCMAVRTRIDETLIAAEDTHRSLTTLACKAILRDEESSSSMTTSMAILFVDWLELLDPEIVAMAPDMQQQLLFAREKVKNVSRSDVGHNSRPYLLTLLTHQSSWATLQRCISCLLLQDNVVKFSPSGVLDFLWAALQIPKLWRGREHRTPKNHIPEDILGLNSDHVISIVIYIIEEAILLYPDKDLTAKQISTERQICIANRVDLLMKCIGENSDSLKRVISHIQDISVSNSNKLLYQQLLVEMYSQCPKIMFWLTDIQSAFTEGQLSQTNLTQVDLVSHRLLTCLGQAGHGKRAEDRMYDANIACRKLASQHPVLMLRQLPLIAALLKGKTQFTFGEMRHKNYLLLFTHILGLMETLQPHIYRREYTALADVIDSYFALISTHGKGKQLAPMIHKYIKFLHQYAVQEPQQSSLVLQKYVDLLSGISATYPDLTVLKSLLAGLTLSRQADTNQGEVTQVISQPRSTSPWTVGQLMPFLKRLQTATDSDDVMEVLHDLDETSKRKVDILEHFIGDLKKLLLNNTDAVRNTAYSLVMRYIRHNPRASEQFVGSFLHCFDSANPDIINSALKNLPEFCVLCQDHADEILQKSFTVGTTTAIETSSYISETLQLLNLETVQI